MSLLTSDEEVEEEGYFEKKIKDCTISSFGKLRLAIGSDLFVYLFITGNEDGFTRSNIRK